MSATMLQLIQQATAEMGLGVPSAVASNTSRDTTQLLALLNAVGYELQREYAWQKLAIAYTFNTEAIQTTGDLVADSAVITNIPSTVGLDTTYGVIGSGVQTAVMISSVDSATQVTISQPSTNTGVGETIYFCKTQYSFPADYDRPTDRTQWDKTKHWEMLGPETAQQWQWLQNGFIATGPRIRFRPMGGLFQIWPPQSTTDLLGFEYVSSNWALTAAGVPKSSFTLDNDTCIFPDRLMVLGLKLKFFEAKQFDTTAHFRNYTMQLDIAKANDSGSKTLSMAPQMSDVLIGWDQIPDSNYGTTT